MCNNKLGGHGGFNPGCQPQKDRCCPKPDCCPKPPKHEPYRKCFCQCYSCDWVCTEERFCFTPKEKENKCDKGCGGEPRGMCC